MQLGFVGLGKMGGNMVHRIHRDSDHQVVAFDRHPEDVEKAESHGATGASGARGHREQARRPAHRVDDGAGRRAHAGHGGCARRAARGGRHDRRRRQLALDRRQAARRGAEGEGHPLRRRGHQRRRVGHQRGLLHDGRRSRRGGAAPGADPRRARPARDRRARPRLGPLRRLRRRALREDGPQRRGVRPDAGLRRGLRPLRQVRVRDRQRQGRPPLDAGLGGALVAVRAGGDRVRAGGQRPGQPHRPHGRLGRGPVDDRGRDGQGRAHAGDHRRAVRALLHPRQRRLHRAGCSRRCATSSAATACRPRPRRWRTPDGHRNQAASRTRRTRWPRASSAFRSIPPRSRSSAPPATWASASCCRRSTTSPTRARCPSAST